MIKPKKVPQVPIPILATFPNQELLYEMTLLFYFTAKYLIPKYTNTCSLPSKLEKEPFEHRRAHTNNYLKAPFNRTMYSYKEIEERTSVVT